MSINSKKVALVYDFDRTLSTSDMQDYGLIPSLGMTPEEFWPKANQWSVDNRADQVTGSMFYFIKVAKEKNIKITKDMLKKFGEKIEYYKGVQTWFDRINDLGKSLGLEIEHYIISAGYWEILKGCEIYEKFTYFFACSYAYDENGEAIWPARVVNATVKTQCLSKINKGLKQTDDRAVNEYTPDNERPIPYRRMIYFGDGLTDIPSMRMVKEKGGISIAVYEPKSQQHKETAIKLLKDGRVDFSIPADYSKKQELDIVVKAILEKVSKERELEILKANEDKKLEH